MTAANYKHIVVERAICEADSPIWPEGPSLTSLVSTFVRSCVEAVHLDSWLPLGSKLTHPVIGYFFQGFALRLADEFVLHRKVAHVALAYAFCKSLFPDQSPAESMALISSLGLPRLDGTVKHEAIHMLGANAADEWMSLGVEAPPPTWQVAEFIKLVETHAVPDALNPDGASDLATRLSRLTTNSRSNF